MTFWRKTVLKRTIRCFETVGLLQQDQAVMPWMMYQPAHHWTRKQRAPCSLWTSSSTLWTQMEVGTYRWPSLTPSGDSVYEPWVSRQWWRPKAFQFATLHEKGRTMLLRLVVAILSKSLVFSSMILGEERIAESLPVFAGFFLTVLAFLELVWPVKSGK